MDGGLSKNYFMMRLQAGISCRRLARSAKTSLSALGAVRMAAVRRERDAARILPSEVEPMD
nr:hypothetical protein GCM10017611_23310 [Rhodococcus wratislaviensis]